MMQRLETERLILRQPEPADWPAARAFFMSERATMVGGPHDLGDAWHAFANEVGHWSIRGYGMWVVTERGDERALGMVGPWYPAHWPETEIGWMIWAADAEGRGIAHEAAKAALAHAWDVLGWQTIVSYIDPDNHRSLALARRLGALFDPAAPQPRPDKPCHVYRHARPPEQNGGRHG